MIKRIVKMEFEPTSVEAFVELFNAHKNDIAHFEGCMHLELCNELGTSVFFTLSWWESEQHLENYRNSELFNLVWSNTKKFFIAKPQAWTVQTLYSK